MNIDLFLPATVLIAGSIFAACYYFLNYYKTLQQFRENIKSGDVVQIKLYNKQLVKARVIQQHDESQWLVCFLDTREVCSIHHKFIYQ